jgi:putative ABC transport system permease protein
MNLWKIAWRSIRQRQLASILTGLSMALGVALVVVVLVVYGVLDTYFMQAAAGYDLIIGAKGSKQQLVFNTVYHLDQPIENIPYAFYREFTDGKFARWTRLAIPYCLGDSYRAAGQTFRVVGTTPDLVDQVEYGRNRDGSAKHYAIEPGGRNFKQQNFFEAVIGSVVAHATGLKVGATFRPAHGIVAQGQEVHQHHEFTIVGILAPTGTPNDRALFVNIEGFYLLADHAKPHGEETGVDEAELAHDQPPAGGAATAPHQGAQSNQADASAGPDSPKHNLAQAEQGLGHADGHAEDDHVRTPHGGHERPLPEDQREVTAILVVVKSPLFSDRIYNRVNEGTTAQAVYPVREMTKFFTTFLQPVQLILLVLTVLIVIVAGVSILVSIYNSMSDRRHDIAVMRALGASRGTVMAVIILESVLLSLASGLVGILIGHGMLHLVSPLVVQRTGVSLSFLQYNTKEFLLIPGLVLLASLVGLLPAAAAYRTDVARSLSHTP